MAHTMPLVVSYSTSVDSIVIFLNLKIITVPKERQVTRISLFLDTHSVIQIWQADKVIPGSIYGSMQVHLDTKESLTAMEFRFGVVREARGRGHIYIGRVISLRIPTLERLESKG